MKIINADKLGLLAGHIAKLKTKVDYRYNGNNEFVFARFHYYYKSRKGNQYNYTNSLIFRKEGVYLTNDSKNLDLPAFYYKVFDIYPQDSKYMV